MKKGQNQRCFVTNASRAMIREENCNSWFQGIECEENERLVVYDRHVSGWCIVCNTSGRYGWIRSEDFFQERPTTTTPTTTNHVVETKEMEETKEAGVVEYDETTYNNQVWNWNTDVQTIAEDVDTKFEEDEDKKDEDIVEDEHEVYADQESSVAGYCVRMVSNYDDKNGQEDEDGQRLVAASGDYIEVIEEHESGWWCGQIKGGERDGEVGWFPCSFVEWADPVGEEQQQDGATDSEDQKSGNKTVTNLAASTFGLFEDSSQMASNVVEVAGFVRVLAAYEPNEDELGLEEGSVIAVLEMQESGWWYVIFE